MDPLKELPLGFGMALVRNEKAMLRFSALPEAQKEQLLARTHEVSSKAEMQELVDSIADDAKM
ncbi:MAG: hypothetical protein ACOX66_02885 [Oscillospiraceae bacterium]|jgi:hypothetical protein